MTYQLIYSSLSSTPMQPDELDDLLEQAQDNNQARGITGALIYVDGFFLQILEGKREAVEQVMRKISKDVRHGTVALLQEGEMPAAAFSDWKMAYASATPDQVARWAGLSSTTRLPDVWAKVRQDRSRVAQLADGILATLVAG